jgi:hypothetical protein
VLSAAELSALGAAFQPGAAVGTGYPEAMMSSVEA